MSEQSRTPKAAKKAGEGAKALNTWQYIAALAIALGKSQREAAIEAGVTRRTVEKWIAEIPEFRQVIAEEASKIAERRADELIAYDIADKAQRVAVRQERANWLKAAIAELQDRFMRSPNPSEAMQTRIVQLLKLEIENETQVSTELGQRIQRIDLNQLSDDRLMELVGQVFNGNEDADPGAGQESTD